MDKAIFKSFRFFFHFTNLIFSVQNDNCVTFTCLHYNILVLKKDFQCIKFFFEQVLPKNFTSVLVRCENRDSEPTFDKLLIQIRNLENPYPYITVQKLA